MNTKVHKRGFTIRISLFPYLFVLSMERLGEMITNEVNVNRWGPIQLSRYGLSFSHLYIADDVFLFTKAKISQACHISRVLEDFCSYSGLKVKPRENI